MSNRNVSRRSFLKVGASGAVVAVVAGIGVYLTLQPTATTPMPVRPLPVASPTPSPSPTPASPAPRPPSAAPAVTTSPTPPPTPAPTLVDKANEEGAVTFYSAFDLETVEAQVKGFEKKYPRIKVEVVRAGGGEIISRYLAEHRAKKEVMDTIHAALHQIMPAQDEGMLAVYDSPQAAVFPKELRDPEGRWTSVVFAPQVIAYNADLVKKAELPLSFWDLLKPRFKGKGKLVLFDPRRAPQVLLITRKIIGENRWLEYLRNLSGQDPIISSRGMGEIVTLLRQGEGEIAVWSYVGSILAQTVKGIPLDFVRRAGTMVTVPNPAAINKYAPHPNAARLLYDHLLSEEGQRAVADMGGYVPNRPGVASKIGVGIGTGERVQATDIDYITRLTEKEMDAAVDEFKQAFRLS